MAKCVAYRRFDDGEAATLVILGIIALFFLATYVVLEERNARAEDVRAKQIECIEVGNDPLWCMDAIR